jgi:hypothetical protein
MIFIPNGALWKNIRKIENVHLGEIFGEIDNFAVTCMGSISCQLFIHSFLHKKNIVTSGRREHGLHIFYSNHDNETGLRCNVT